MTMQTFIAVIQMPDGSQREVGRLALCYYEAKVKFEAEFGLDGILYGPWSLPVSDHIAPMTYQLPGW
jgi:hypothetical protein